MNYDLNEDQELLVVQLTHKIADMEEQIAKGNE